MAFAEEDVVVAIQARLSSSRLPGKVLMDLRGEPMLKRVYDACAGPWRRTILTSTHGRDAQISFWCRRQGISCVRGDLEDVLSRYVTVAERARPKCLVRVCGDAPFMERAWIQDAVIESAGRHPAFKPGALHAGHWTHWMQANEWCEKSDREHAGHGWFHDHGAHLPGVPTSHFTVNTIEDLDRAREQWAAKPG